MAIADLEFEAFDREFAELTQTSDLSKTSLKVAIGGTSVALTVGFVGWLLRGGALLSALLSSIPVWQQFDPLAILRQQRKRKGEDEPESNVERMFGEATHPDSSVRGVSA